MATLVCGTVAVDEDILEGRAEKLEEWEEEKGREGGVAENGFLYAAVVVGLGGFCWKTEVTATERLRLERREVRSGRRKVEENSLKSGGGGGVDSRNSESERQL